MNINKHSTASPKNNISILKPINANTLKDSNQNFLLRRGSSKSPKHRLSYLKKKPENKVVNFPIQTMQPKDQRSKSAMQRSRGDLRDKGQTALNQGYKLNHNASITLNNTVDQIKHRNEEHMKQRINDSTSGIVDEIKQLSMVEAYESRDNTLNDKKKLVPNIRKFSSHNVPKAVPTDFKGFDMTYKVINNIKERLKEREQLISSMFFLNSKAQQKEYQDFDIEFSKTPIELKQEILMGEGYNVTELDTIQEIWHKTEKAMKLLKDEEENIKRDQRNKEQFSHINYSADDNMAVECIRANNPVNEFYFDNEEFKRVLEENERELDEKVNKSFEQYKLKQQKKLLSNQEARKTQASSIFTKTKRPVQENQNKNKGERLHASFDGYKQDREYTEKLQKFEKEIDKKLDTKLKYYQMMGIFSEDKNKIRIETAKYVALFKEKAKQARLSRPTSINNQRESVKPPNGMSKSPSGKSIGTVNEPVEQSEIFKVPKKPENSVLNQVQDLLTRPIKDTLGNKTLNIKVFQKRLYDLRRKYNNTQTEQVRPVNFTRLQLL